MFHPIVKSSEKSKMDIKRQKDALNEDDVLAELEKLSSNWKIYNLRPSKERIKLIELSHLSQK